MTTGVLLAACRVHSLLPTKDSTGVTAIDKRSVPGPVSVHKLGLTGDIQASRRHHGGEFKAVYAYSQEDADFWAAALGRDIAPGLFGENLRVAGIDVSNAVVGERWQLGADVVLEVTEPRTPCVNFARRMGETRWVRRFTDENRVGSYLRVIRGGAIQAGGPVTVISQPDHGITVAQVFAGLSSADAQRLLDAQGGQLSPTMRRVLRKVTAKPPG